MRASIRASMRASDGDKYRPFLYYTQACEQPLRACEYCYYYYYYYYYSYHIVYYYIVSLLSIIILYINTLYCILIPYSEHILYLNTLYCINSIKNIRWSSTGDRSATGLPWLPKPIHIYIYIYI